MCGSHTFAVYENFCMITVRSHQYCLLVYFLLCQARLAVYSFEQLLDISPPILSLRKD
jgi:hypothetical protein